MGEKSPAFLSLCPTVNTKGNSHADGSTGCLDAPAASMSHGAFRGSLWGSIPGLSFTSAEISGRVSALEIL